MTKSLVDVYTVTELFSAVGDDITNRWESIGQAYDVLHWRLAEEAFELIPEFPAMLVYKAIGIKTGISEQVVRKAYKTYMKFDKVTRDAHPLCPYSVFQHARTQDDPISVLDYYEAHRPSVRELESVFPVIRDEETEQDLRTMEYPRYFYGILREMRGLLPEQQLQIKAYLSNIKKILDVVK